MELAEAELHVEEGKAPEDQHGEVGDEESAAPVLETHVREPMTSLYLLEVYLYPISPFEGAIGSWQRTDFKTDAWTK